MGTSADRGTGRGGSWTPLKHAATSYAASAAAGAGGSADGAARVLARHLPVLGGAGAAAGSARAGVGGIARLGGLLAGVGANGLASTLAQLGLTTLIGRDRFDVLDELITLIAGDGSDLESQATRDAACDVLDEIYADADTWQDLDAVGVTEESVGSLLTLFLAKYVYNRLPVLPERLARLLDPAAAQAADRQMVALIHDLVRLHMPVDPLHFDWGGPDGRQFAEDAVRDVYAIIAALDEGAA